MNTIWFGSHINNYEKGRRTVKKPSLIVLHWSFGNLAVSDALFAKSDSLTSTHYGVSGKEIHQYVQEDATAFHAGTYQNNIKSIGITVEGSKDILITEESYQLLFGLVGDICHRHAIPIDRDHIKGHGELFPDNEQFSKERDCPGSLDISRVIIIAKERSPQTIIANIQKKARKNREGFIALATRLGVDVSNLSLDAAVNEAIQIIDIERRKTKTIKDILKRERVNEDQLTTSITDLTTAVKQLYDRMNSSSLLTRLFTKIRRIFRFRI